MSDTVQIEWNKKTFGMLTVLKDSRHTEHFFFFSEKSFFAKTVKAGFNGRRGDIADFLLAFFLFIR